MPITSISLQGTFTKPDESPASGFVEVTLQQSMLGSDGEFVPASSINALLDSNGRIIAPDYGALIVAATNDVGIEPSDPESGYLITCKISGAPVPQFFANIDHASTVIDDRCVTNDGSPIVLLGRYIASVTMLGLPVVGVGVPGGAVAIDFDIDANSLTLDVNCDGSSAPFTALTLGGVVEITSLMPTT